MSVLPRIRGGFEAVDAAPPQRAPTSGFVADVPTAEQKTVEPLAVEVVSRSMGCVPRTPRAPQHHLMWQRSRGIGLHQRMHAGPPAPPGSGGAQTYRQLHRERAVLAPSLLMPHLLDNENGAGDLPLVSAWPADNLGNTAAMLADERRLIAVASRNGGAGCAAITAVRNTSSRGGGGAGSVGSVTPSDAEVPLSATPRHSQQHGPNSNDINNNNNGGDLEMQEYRRRILTSTAKSAVVQELELFISREGARTKPLAHRVASYCQALDSISNAVASFRSIAAHVKDFVRELHDTVQATRASVGAEIAVAKTEVAKEKDAFYQRKMMQILMEKRALGRRLVEVGADKEKLRHERDQDLSEAKAKVWETIQKIHGDHHHEATMRTLVAAVFRTNDELKAEAAELRGTLQRVYATGIVIPAAPSNLLGVSTAMTGMSASTMDTSVGDEATLGGTQRDAHNASAVQPAGGQAAPQLVDAAPPPVVTVTQATSTAAPVTGVVPVLALPPANAPTASSLAVGGGGGAGGHMSAVAAAAAAAAAATPSRHLKDQVPVEFIEASRRELAQCRLSTQKALIDSATEMRSSYKGRLERAVAEKNDVVDRVKTLEAEVDRLERQIHGARFGASTHPKHQQHQQQASNASGKPLSILVDDAEEEADVPREDLTPRPRLPFEVQSKLGVSMKPSSRAICEALAKAALTMHEDLATLHQRIPRLVAATAWMDAQQLRACGLAAEDEHGPSLLTPVPGDDWPHTPHFLRTRIEAPLPNHGWSAFYVTRIVWRFFARFTALREECRHFRDDRCCAPRQTPLWDARRDLLPPRDATIADMDVVAAAANNKQAMDPPIGYMVTRHLQLMLLESSGKVAIPLTAARRGIGLRDAIPDPVPEAELATAAYNFWHAVRKHRGEQPLCDLFLLVLDGRLPWEVFQASNDSLSQLAAKLSAADGARTGSVKLRQITACVLSLTGDRYHPLWREALYAVHTTIAVFGEGGSLHDSCSLSSLLAVENGYGGSTTGATILCRVWRRHIVRQYCSFFERLLSALDTCVFESAMVPNLVLMRVDDAYRAARTLDETLDRRKAMVPTKASFEEIVRRVASRCARLNSSVHARPASSQPHGRAQGPSDASAALPASGASGVESGANAASSPRAASPLTVGGGGGASGGGGERKGRLPPKVKRRVRNEQAPPLLLDAVKDHELVEWCTFRSLLTRTMPAELGATDASAVAAPGGAPVATPVLQRQTPGEPTPIDPVVISVGPGWSPQQHPLQRGSIQSGGAGLLPVSGPTSRPQSRVQSRAASLVPVTPNPLGFEPGSVSPAPLTLTAVIPI